MTNVQFTSVTTDEGQQFLTVFAEGKLLPPVDDSHPNFAQIKATCLDAMEGISVDTDRLVTLFDVAETIREQFARLSDRVTVKNGVILLDGDPVHGTLQDQILSFVDAGEDFAPLVNFYEKLLTNPLGDVREGLYTWIAGQKAEGNFTITPEGDILGYKGVMQQAPGWRTDEEIVYVPSRRGEGIVNGRDVTADEFIEQVVGDIVEMPRSRVLHEPSAECGDGLHIGTWAYAKGFGDGTTMLVQFSPRDIVSLPDSNSSWKLRVCRYTVIDLVDEPLEAPVYQTATEPEDDHTEVTISLGVDIDLSLDESAGVKVGDRVRDSDGDEGIVTSISDGTVYVHYDGWASPVEACSTEYTEYLEVIDNDEEPEEDDGSPIQVGTPVQVDSTCHGVLTGKVQKIYDDESVMILLNGGNTYPVDSIHDLVKVDSKGDPYADVRGEGGRFVHGRPGSARDSSTGRFA